jgi:hypothetical protein
MNEVKTEASGLAEKARVGLLGRVARAARAEGEAADYARDRWCLQVKARAERQARELMTETDWRNAAKLDRAEVPVVLLDAEQRMIWRVRGLTRVLVPLVVCRTRVACRNCWARLLECAAPGAAPELHLPVASAKRPEAAGFAVARRWEHALVAAMREVTQDGRHRWLRGAECGTTAELDAWWQANVVENPLALEV